MVKQRNTIIILKDPPFIGTIIGVSCASTMSPFLNLTGEIRSYLHHMMSVRMDELRFNTYCSLRIAICRFNPFIISHNVDISVNISSSCRTRQNPFRIDIVAERNCLCMRQIFAQGKVPIIAFNAWIFCASIHDSVRL